jgi:hypothetical protein
VARSVIQAGTNQGIYYQIDGAEGARNLTIERIAVQQGYEAYAHFMVSYQEAVPNVFEYTYFENIGNGNRASVGAQTITR